MVKAKKIIFNLIYPLIVLAIVLLIWFIAARSINTTIVLPTPSSAFKRFFAYFTEIQFYRALLGTLWRSTYSFAISFALALAFAVLSALDKRLAAFFKSLNSFVRTVPTMSVIFLLIIWLSPSAAPAAVAIIVISPTLYSSFCAAYEQVDKQLVSLAKVYKVPTARIIFKIYIPNMSKGMVEGSASGFSLNIKLIIAAEALSKTFDSLGSMMQDAKIWLEAEELMAITIASVLLGVLFEALIRGIGRLFVSRGLR